MNLPCALCHQPVDLLTLDDEGYVGLPAHATCAGAARAALAAMLDEATARILAEPDPRRHRRHLRPAA
jgi:hypothetical protein